MMFPKFWTQSDIDLSMKLDNSGSYEFQPLDFTQNSPNDSSQNIMMFPKFWTQSDIDWSMKLDNSGSYDVRSEMEWLVYCIVLATGFTSKLTNCLLRHYYDVPQFQPLDFTQNSPNDSSHNVMMLTMFWTQSDIDWSMKLDNSSSYEVHTKFVLKWGGWCIAQFQPLDFTQNSPNDSSHNMMMFPKFWTQSDIDWSKKLDNSGSYEVRSEMVYCVVLAIGFHSKLTKSLLPQHYDVPKFWTQSDIDWSMKLDNSASYEVRSEMEWLMYCTVLYIGIQPLDFTQNSPNESSHNIMMFPKFWTRSDIDWSMK
ncbi:unnamed protein product [Prunus armeniaca]